MPKTGIRSYQTKTYGRRWLAYYSRDGKQVLRRGFRTSRQAEQAAAWLTIPASEEPEVSYMNAEELARRYRITEDLGWVRLQGRSV